MMKGDGMESPMKGREENTDIRRVERHMTQGSRRCPHEPKPTGERGHTSCKLCGRIIVPSPLSVYNPTGWRLPKSAWGNRKPGSPEVCDGYYDNDIEQGPCGQPATRAFFNKADGEGWVLCCAGHHPHPREDYTRKTLDAYRRRFEVTPIGK